MRVPLIILLLAPLLVGAGSAQATPLTVPVAADGRTWVWPLAPRPPVLRPFDGPPAPWSPGHRGVDLAAGPGQPIRAPDDGVVVFSGVVVDRVVITVEHPGGLRSSFEAVTDPLAVGTPVVKGQEVARVAPGNHCRTTCLHWGVRRGEEYLNPLQFLPRRYAVLLPDTPPG